MAKAATAAVREKIAALEEEYQLAQRLEQAEGAQAQLAAMEQALQVAKTAVLSEESRLKELEQAQQDARAVLKALHAEREAAERELQAFAKMADQQDRDFVARLQGVIPEAPELTPEEANLA